MGLDLHCSCCAYRYLQKTNFQLREDNMLYLYEMGCGTRGEIDGDATRYRWW